MELHIKIIGALLVALALMHYFFPKYFNWKEECRGMSPINRQMMYIHTFFIGLVVLLMGWLCLTSATELVNTPLGRRISLGMGIFWVARLYIQFFGYSSSLWRGKRFETTVHWLFTAVWVYLSVVFVMVYMGVNT
jgi:hypothetical protein